MKLTHLLFLALAHLCSRPASGATFLEKRAQEAAVELPRGCIVTVEQKEGGKPFIAAAGKAEPAGVPPEQLIFEIGSISKVFTGLLLSQAVIEGKVKLETTLREVMGAKQSFADPQVAAITLLQLATHASGLPRLPDNGMEAMDASDPYAHYDRVRLDSFLAAAKLAHAPPFPSEYSNLGVGLLGDLLSRLYGKTWEELVVERIAKPLGMDDTCVTLTAAQERRVAPPYAGGQRATAWHFQAMAGAGALHSTGADMLRFGLALADPSKTPLKKAIELAQQPRADGSIGLCLMIQKQGDQTTWWHNGGTGGFRSFMSVAPATSHVVVMLVNNGALAPETVMAGAKSKKLTPLPPPSKPSGPIDPLVADYVGDYDTGVKAAGTDIHYRFEARGADLWMQITGQPAIPLERHPTSKDRFVFKPVQAEIQFAREKGAVVSTTLFQAGMEIKARRLGESAKAK